MVIELQLRLSVPSFQLLQAIRHIKIAFLLGIGDLLFQFPFLLIRRILLNGLLFFFLSQDSDLPLQLPNFIC